MSYETVIGLEVHLQLSTETKAFCGCSTKFGEGPNSQVCPVCLGFPGVLPVLNEKAFYYSIKVALALNCSIQEMIKFDRKNYYYPDLPKNFQISQYDMPLSYDGFVNISSKGKAKRIGIRRVHLEEDAGKLIHETKGNYSLVDYNRAGEPLLEIVTEPDINSPEEAYEYLTNLKSVLEYLEVSDCDMEKGSLRCDANISVRKPGEKKLGAKVELKNMNSFKGVKAALEYEEKRQVSLLEGGEKVTQETRLWDPEKSVTVSMRYKEEAEDYRYFPEPDLVPFVVDKKVIEKIRGELPELPDARFKRFLKNYGLSEYDAGVLTADKEVADYFEECAGLYDNPKTISNWITGDIMARANLKNARFGALGLLPESLAGLLKMIDSGAISGKMAKDILLEAMETRKRPEDIVRSKNLSQISDAGELERVVKAVLEKEAKSVTDYKSGKKNALTFLVGRIMKETKGKANPRIVNDLLRKMLVVFIAVLMASSAFGGYDKQKDKAKSKEDLYAQVELFADAISVIRSDYVDEVESKKLIYGALRGMLYSLDDFSEFMEPDEYNQIKIDAKGEFGGVGIEISMKDGVLTIITPIAGTPADEAGIKPGDKIVRINGKTTKDMTLQEAVKTMRGSPGTPLTLTIWREKDQKVLEIPMKRAMIKLKSIRKALILEDKIGYIKLIEFQENTPRDLEEALKKLENEGMDSLILDLRNNPGGLLEAAVAVSEKFLPKDSPVVSIKGRVPEQNTVFKSSGKFTHPDYPILVLVNEGSASAAEIVAGAMQDHKRAVILGMKTFGKGSVQTVLPLKDGSALRLTTASYFTPSGRMIRSQGVVPDVVVEREESKGELKVKDGKDGAAEIFEKMEEKVKEPFKEVLKEEKVERDSQIERAVDLMKALKVYRVKK